MMNMKKRSNPDKAPLGFEFHPVKDLRVKARGNGFSMAEVCREAEIDHSQASRWLQGHHVPLTTSFARLQQALERLISRKRLQV
jgi:transcriptional regulator with XRE-family HTH domain